MSKRDWKVKHLIILCVLNVLTLNIIYAGCCKKNKNKDWNGCCVKKALNIKNDISNEDNNEDINKKPDDHDPNRKPGDDGNGDPEETEEEKNKKLLEKQKQDDLKKQLNDYKTKIQSALNDIPPLLKNVESNYNVDNSKDGDDLSKVNVLGYNTIQIKTKLDEVSKMFKNDALYTDANTGFKTKLDSLNTRYNTLDTNIKALSVKVNEVKVKLAKNKDKDDLISEIDNLLKEIEDLLKKDKDNSLIGIKNTTTKSIEKKLEITKYIGIFNDIKINLKALEEKVGKLTGDEKTTNEANVNGLKAKIINSEDSILDLFKKKFIKLKNDNPTKVIEDFINTNFTEDNLKADTIKKTSENIKKFKDEHDFSNLSEFKIQIESIVNDNNKNILYKRKISEIIIYREIENLFNDFSNKNNKIDKIGKFCETISEIYALKENDLNYEYKIIGYLTTLDCEIGDDTDEKLISILKNVINSIIDNKFTSKIDSKKLDQLEDFSKYNDNGSILNYFKVIDEAKYTLSNVDITSFSKDYNNLKHLQCESYNKKIKDFKDKLEKKSKDNDYIKKSREINNFSSDYNNEYKKYEEYSKEITPLDFTKDDLDFSKLKGKLNSIKTDDIEKSFDNIKKLEEDFNNYKKLLDNTKKDIDEKIKSGEKLLGMLNNAENGIYFKYKKIDTAAKITEISDEINKLKVEIDKSFGPKINEYYIFSNEKEDKFKKFYNYYNRKLILNITLNADSFNKKKDEKICQLTLETKDFDGNDIKYASTDTDSKELKREKYDYKDSLRYEIKNCSKFKISDNLYNEIKRKSCTKNLKVGSNIFEILPKDNPYIYNYYLIIEIKDGEHYIYFVPIKGADRLCSNSNQSDFFGSYIILSGYMPYCINIDNNTTKEIDLIKIHNLNTKELCRLDSNIKFFDLRGLNFKEVEKDFIFPNSTIVFHSSNIGDEVKFKYDTLYSLSFKKNEKVTVYIVKNNKNDNTNNEEYQNLLKKFPEDNHGRITVKFIDEDDPIFKN